MTGRSIVAGGGRGIRAVVMVVVVIGKKATIEGVEGVLSKCQEGVKRY